jgi:hypothetical protein
MNLLNCELMIGTVFNTAVSKCGLTQNRLIPSDKPRRELTRCLGHNFCTVSVIQICTISSSIA